MVPKHTNIYWFPGFGFDSEPNLQLQRKYVQQNQVFQTEKSASSLKRLITLCPFARGRLSPQQVDVDETHSLDFKACLSS